MGLLLGLVAWAIPLASADTANIQDKPDLYYSYVVAKYVPLSIEKYDSCSCVSYAKWKLGIPQSEHWGNAGKIQPISDKPLVGDLILTKEGGGHIAVVYAFDDTQVCFDESNYKSCQQTRRCLPINSNLIRGYR